MHAFTKKSPIWRVGKLALAVTLSVLLSGCLDIKGDLKISSSGEADLKLSIDSSKMEEFSRSMGGKSNTLNCEDFLKDKPDSALWQCEMLQPAMLQARRHYSTEDAKAFLSVEISPLTKSYRLDPAQLFINPSQGSNREKQGADIAKLKPFGLIFGLDVSFPGNVVLLGQQAPAKSENKISLDFTDPALWASDYRVEARESKVGQLIGMIAIAGLLITGSLWLKRQEDKPAKLRQAALPVSLIISALLLSQPWWANLASTAPVSTSAIPAGAAVPALPAAEPQPAPPEQKLPDVTTVSVPSLPEAQPAPAATALSVTFVESQTTSQQVSNAPDSGIQDAAAWDVLIGQHPYSSFDHQALAKLLVPLLGMHYSYVKDALAVSSGFERSGQFLVVSGIAEHQGGTNEAALALDTLKGKLYGAWHTGDHIYVFGVRRVEDLPSWLLDWYLKHGGPASR